MPAVLERPTTQVTIPFLLVEKHEEDNPGKIIRHAEGEGAFKAGENGTRLYHLQLRGMLPKFYTLSGLRYLLLLRGVNIIIDSRTSDCERCSSRANCPLRMLAGIFF